MVRRGAEEAPEVPASWSDQVPCEECGARPGYNPSTGVEVKQGHYSNCSQWKQE